MQGTRLPDAAMGEPGSGWEAWTGNEKGHGEVVCPRGSYMKVSNDGRPWNWYVRDPLGDVCTIRDNHQVTEHPDGTITVSPSIINPNGTYHGFLQHGEWS